MGVLVFLLLQPFLAGTQGRCADRKKGPSLAAIPPAIPSNPSNRSPGGPDSYSASAQAGGCFPVGARPPGDLVPLPPHNQIPSFTQASAPTNLPGTVPAVTCGAGRANNPFRRDPFRLLTRPLH